MTHSNDMQLNFPNGTKESRDERLVCFACNQIHTGARLITTEDGRTLGNYSAEYFLYGEACWVFKKKKTKNTRRQYLEQIREIRGQEAYLKLHEEMMRIWTARNAKLQQKQASQK